MDANNEKVLLIEDDLTEIEDDTEDENESEIEDDKNKDIAITGSALEKASAAALKHIGKGKVTDTEIGDEDGYYEVEITLDNKREVDVHLDENFKVISEKWEDNEDDDDKEDDDNDKDDEEDD